MTRLFHTIGYVFLFNVLSAGIGYLFTIMIARMLSVEDFGRVSLVISYIYICSTIADFGMSNAVVTIPNSCANKIGNQILFFFNYLFLKIASITFPITLITLFFIFDLEKFSALELSIWVVSSFSFLLFRYAQSLQQSQGKWKSYNIINTLNNFLKIFTLLVAGIFLTDVTIDAVLYSYLTYSCLLLLGSIIYLSSFGISSSYKKERNLQTRINKYLCYIGLSNIFVVLTMRMDLVFIDLFLTENDLGIYSAANSLALIIPLFTGAIMNVLLKYIPGSPIAFLIQLKKIQLKAIPPAIILIILLFFLSSHIISVIYGARYEGAVIYFSILGSIYLLSILFTPLEAYFYSERPRSIFFLKIGQFISMFLILYFFIEEWELYGVILSILLSKMLSWTYLFVQMNLVLRKV